MVGLVSLVSCRHAAPRWLYGDTISIPGVMPSCSPCSPSVAVWSLALACIDRWREHVASCHSLTLTRGTAEAQAVTNRRNNQSGCIESKLSRFIVVTITTTL